MYLSKYAIQSLSKYLSVTTTHQLIKCNKRMNNLIDKTIFETWKKRFNTHDIRKSLMVAAEEKNQESNVARRRRDLRFIFCCEFSPSSNPLSLYPQ